MTMSHTLLGIVVAIFGILNFVFIWFFQERTKKFYAAETAKILKELEWNYKRREQAAKVAEYLALATFLQESDEKSLFRRANQLSWELALWLPDETYRQTVRSIVEPSDNINALTSIMSVRKLLLGSEAGTLHSEEIAFHAPGVGKGQHGINSHAQ